MDLEQLKKQYQEMETIELKSLAESYDDMRPDVLPVLFAELENRGEQEFLSKLKVEMEKDPEDKEIEDGMLLRLFKPDSINIKPQNKKDAVAELLDDDMPALEATSEEIDGEVEYQFDYDNGDELLDNEMLVKKKEPIFELTEYEIIDKAYKMILKEKSSLKGRQEAIEYINQYWDLTDEMIEQVFVKLQKKMRNGFIIGGIVGGLFVIGVGIFIASDGEKGFTPGLILVVLGIVGLYNGAMIRRILLN